MTIRMSWQEVSAIIQQHVNIKGVRLGEPRIMAPVQYGPGEEQIEATALEFEILTEGAPVPVSRRVPLDDGIPVPVPPSPLDDPPF